MADIEAISMDKRYILPVMWWMRGFFFRIDGKNWNGPDKIAIMPKLICMVSIGPNCLFHEDRLKYLNAKYEM